MASEIDGADGGVEKRKARLVRRASTNVLPFAPFGLAPLVGLALLLGFALVPFARGWIEQATERAAQAALAEAGATWARPVVSGQWVVLEGRPPSQADADRALAAVRAAKAPTILGLRAAPVTRLRERFDWTGETTGSADPATAPAERPAPAGPAEPLTGDLPEWRFELSDGVLLLQGETPDEETRAAIIEEAEGVIDPPRIAAVDDRLTVVSGLARGEAVTAVALQGVRRIGGCDEGRAAFEAGRLSLRCAVPEAVAASLRARASAPAPLGELGEIEILANEAVATCEQRLAALLSDAKIEFASASAQIDASSARLLDDIAAAAEGCPGVLRIEGHTDDQGDASFNADLSRRRAEAVRDALIERGVRADRLAARGFGEAQPIADNATARGRARNRRIEIKVLRASE